MKAMLHQKRDGRKRDGQSREATLQPRSGEPAPPEPRGGQHDMASTPDYDLIEFLFFAYRDFVGDADRLLESLKFGRAHHRVLHFVQRHPGLTIAELLDILRITKQSLNRVLKELLDENYVEAHPGANDRRQRQLRLTERGHKLAMELAILQSRRFARAWKELPPGSREQAERFLLAMIDPQERLRVEALVRSGVFPHR